MSKQKLKFKIKKKNLLSTKIKKRSKSYVARAVAASSINADVSGWDGAVSQCALFVGDAWSIDFTQDR
jgi:hypothetical protein